MKEAEFYCKEAGINLFKKSASQQKFDAKTQTLHRFKRSSIWNFQKKLPKKTLNPKRWNQIRKTSVIQNDQRLETNVFKKTRLKKNLTTYQNCSERYTVSSSF